jgi:hypothetical protein
MGVQVSDLFYTVEIYDLLQFHENGGTVSSDYDGVASFEFHLFLISVFIFISHGDLILNTVIIIRVLYMAG